MRYDAVRFSVVCRAFNPASPSTEHDTLQTLYWTFFTRCSTIGICARSERCAFLVIGNHTQGHEHEIHFELFHWRCAANALKRNGEFNLILQNACVSVGVAFFSPTFCFVCLLFLFFAQRQFCIGVGRHRLGRTICEFRIWIAELVITVAPFAIQSKEITCVRLLLPSILTFERHARRTHLVVMKVARKRNNNFKSMLKPCGLQLAYFGFLQTHFLGGRSRDRWPSERNDFFIGARCQFSASIFFLFSHRMSKSLSIWWISRNEKQSSRLSDELHWWTPLLYWGKCISGSDSIRNGELPRIQFGADQTTRWQNQRISGILTERTEDEKRVYVAFAEEKSENGWTPINGRVARCNLKNAQIVIKYSKCHPINHRTVRVPHCLTLVIVRSTMQRNASQRNETQ